VYSLLWEALTGQEAAPARAVQLLEKRFGESTAGAQRRRKFVEPLVLVLDELDYLSTTSCLCGYAAPAALSQD
jgi:hypothetical protein